MAHNFGILIRILHGFLQALVNSWRTGRLKDEETIFGSCGWSHFIPETEIHCQMARFGSATGENRVDASDQYHGKGMSIVLPNNQRWLL
jgi:hypothetical protein